MLMSKYVDLQATILPTSKQDPGNTNNERRKMKVSSGHVILWQTAINWEAGGSLKLNF